MPITNPLSLSNDEVYAVCAYIINLNGIVEDDAQMTANTLPQVKMPNHDGFTSDWPVRPH
jgi:cytochrome c